MAETSCGALLIDKPAGITSHDVVAGVRRQFKGVKVGHTGTLDPFATGLLIILLGRATRLQRYLLHLPKTYEVTARLGWRSSTIDTEGELVHTGNVPNDPQIPVGMQMQQVPAFSAVKVDGERLYAKARRGEEFESPSREIEVLRARRLWLKDEAARFEVECSGGTYVRSLIADLGDAYCSELRRTRIGKISIEQADPARIVGVNMLLDHIPSIQITQQQALAVGYGQKLASEQLASEDQATVRLCLADRLIAVAEVVDGLVKPAVVLEPSG